MPTVTITAPAQASAINFGQGRAAQMDVEQRLLVHRNDVEFHGGAFTGAQATSGTATVAPTGSGSVTYTLSCSGAGAWHRRLPLW